MMNADYVYEKSNGLIYGAQQADMLLHQKRLQMLSGTQIQEIFMFV